MLGDGNEIGVPGQIPTLLSSPDPLTLEVKHGELLGTTTGIVSSTRRRPTKESATAPAP